MARSYMTEFDMIKKYFAGKGYSRSDVRCGVGDDAALVSIPPGHELAITTDTLIEGIHFPIFASPFDVGYKSLAVNLSDLAAMGATPGWATMALTLPQKNEKWIQAFCDGFFALAAKHEVELVGGDLTHGPLSITIQMLGFLPADNALLRSSAKPGDLIYVTGTLGDGGLALKSIQENIELDAEHKLFVFDRFNRPTPRVEAGIAMRKLANAAIDISDGLAADLNHILAASHQGAMIYVDQLPLSSALKSLKHQEAITLALTAGDDYELCFTVPKKHEAELIEKLAAICPCTCIGIITEKTGLALCFQDGSKYHGPIQGYQHF